MAWNTPVLRSTGYVVTASDYNEVGYYNMRYLKGLDGTIVLQDDIGLYDNTSANTSATIATAVVQYAHTGALFNAAGLTDSDTFWTQPAGTVLLGIKIILVTQFAAVGMTDLDVTLGDAGDNDGLLVEAMNLTSDAAATEYTTRGAYWDTPAKGSFWYTAAAKPWLAYATAVGANLDTTSAGQIDILFSYLEL